MINLTELKNYILDKLPPFFKINIDNLDRSVIRIHIRWNYSGEYYGNSMYLDNEFIDIDKKTLEIVNRTGTDQIIDKLIEVCNTFINDINK